MTADPRAFVAEALAAHAEGPLVVVVQAPTSEGLEVLRRSRRGDAWLLSRAEAEGSEVVLGLGSARKQALPGEDRMASLSRAVEAAPAWTVVAHEAASPTLVARLPLSLVGLAFDDAASEDEVWRSHGAGSLVVPRWTYLRAGDAAVLAWASTERWAGQASLVLGELEGLLAALAAPTRTSQGPSVDVVGEERSSFASWVDHVEAARGAIRAGELHKVVVARCAAISTARDVCAEDVFCALSGDGALRYLVRLDGATLVGATPERLFSKHGARIRTEALAGTRARGGTARALLESEKDLDEHAPVVAAIGASLRALGATVTVEPRPRIKAVANLVHLRTGVEAELPEGSSVDAAQVLAALHPTPAVGGWPREPALAFIRAHERSRGWYAGPLGWMDALGDADVHVALRCALLRGARAWVYAGAGIVTSSDAAAEWDETALKMAPLLSALGASSAVRPVSHELRPRDALRDGEPRSLEAAR